MMVNLIYFYDIISTMSRNIEINEGWTVRPDKKYKTDNLTLKAFPISSVSIPDLSSFDMRRSQYTLDITSD